MGAWPPRSSAMMRWIWDNLVLLLVLSAFVLGAANYKDLGYWFGATSSEGHEPPHGEAHAGSGAEERGVSAASGPQTLGETGKAPAPGPVPAVAIAPAVTQSPGPERASGAAGEPAASATPAPAQSGKPAGPRESAPATHQASGSASSDVEAALGSAPAQEPPLMNTPEAGRPEAPGAAGAESHATVPVEEPTAPAADVPPRVGHVPTEEAVPHPSTAGEETTETVSSPMSEASRPAVAVEEAASPAALEATASGSAVTGDTVPPEGNGVPARPDTARGETSSTHEAPPVPAPSASAAPEGGPGSIAAQTAPETQPGGTGEPGGGAVSSAPKAEVPGAGTPSTGIDVTALWEEAIQQMARWNWGAAARNLERITAASPGDVRAWQMLGRARLVRGDRPGALAAWERAAELAASRDDMWVFGAMVHEIGRLDPERALRIMDRVRDQH